MTQIHSSTRDRIVPSQSRRRRWPLLATSAGLSGLSATLVLEGRTLGDQGDPRARTLHRSQPARVPGVHVRGYLTVVLLLVFAAVWRRRVEPSMPDSTAVQLVTLALVSSAAGLTNGYGLEGCTGQQSARIPRADGV